MDSKLLRKALDETSIEGGKIMNPKDNINDFFISADSLYRTIMKKDKGFSFPENYRKGLIYFNYLYEVRPNLANSLRATDIEIFYNDSRLAEFYQYLNENWDKIPG